MMSPINEESKQTWVSVSRLASMLLLDDIDTFVQSVNRHMSIINRNGIMCVDADAFHQIRYSILSDYREQVA